MIISSKSSAKSGSRTWSLAGFFFVRFCQRDALRDATAYRLGGMKDRDGPLAIFDDDLRARTRSVSEVFAIGLKRTKLVEPMGL